MSRAPISPDQDSPFHDFTEPRRRKHDHVVQFYESNAYLTGEVARYLAHGFKDGNAMVVIARPEHRAAFKHKLRSQGFDVDLALSCGQLKEFDARETLEKFMDEELPNRDRFTSTIGEVIDDSRSGREHLPVLAYGEIVDILWRDDKCEAAIRLEEFWNELAQRRPFELFCAYSLNGFYKGDHHPQFERICKTHSHVHPTEQYAELDEQERLRRLSLLEQQSLALQSEIEQRRAVEKALLQALDEKRRAEESLKKTEVQLRSVLENASEGIHWVALDGRILWANATEWHASATHRKNMSVTTSANSMPIGK